MLHFGKLLFDQKIGSIVDDVRHDYDRQEISWDFTGVESGSGPLNEAVTESIEKQGSIIEDVKRREEELNSMYIQLYGLKDVLSNEVEQDHVSIRTSNIKEEIIRIISYSIGCVFGRYSLDKPGLQFAGGEFEPEEQRFMPDPDNIIPINDSGYYDDDIVIRFVEFIRVAFGEEHLEENLKFIAENLGIKGSGTSRDIIRKYFLNNFYKDHLKMYSNLPIYWLFDSGKENGFKALIYMHRYTPDLIPRMRQDYFLPMLTRYMEQSRTAEGASKAVLQKKIEELQTYDIALEKYASDKVSIDLDDGIRVNYAKFQNIENPGSGKKIDLLYSLK